MSDHECFAKTTNGANFDFRFRRCKGPIGGEEKKPETYQLRFLMDEVLVA